MISQVMSIGLWLLSLKHGEFCAAELMFGLFEFKHRYPDILWKSLFDGTFLCEDNFCPLLHKVGPRGDNRKRGRRAQRRVGPKSRPTAGPPGPRPRVSAGFP